MLQNLLSDDEDNSIADDVDSVAVVESDHFENHAVVDTPQVSPRKKRVRASGRDDWFSVPYNTSLAFS